MAAKGRRELKKWRREGSRPWGRGEDLRGEKTLKGEKIRGQRRREWGREAVGELGSNIVISSIIDIGIRFKARGMAVSVPALPALSVS